MGGSETLKAAPRPLLGRYKVVFCAATLFVPQSCAFFVCVKRLFLAQRARAQPSHWVLVHGATGGVGIATVQMAVAAGMKVIATSGSTEGTQLLVQNGVAATHSM